MANTDEKILKALEALQADVATIKTQQRDQGKDIKTLKADVKTVDLKVEAAHEFNKKAHAETMETLLDIDEINYQELKKELAELKKRIEQLEARQQN